MIVVDRRIDGGTELTKAKALYIMLKTVGVNFMEKMADLMCQCLTK